MRNSPFFEFNQVDTFPIFILFLSPSVRPSHERGADEAALSLPRQQHLRDSDQPEPLDPGENSSSRSLTQPHDPTGTLLQSRAQDPQGRQEQHFGRVGLRLLQHEHPALGPRLQPDC